MGVKALIVVVALASLSCASALKCMTNNGNDVSVLATNTSVSVECAPRHQCGALYFSVHHPGDNIRANGTSQKWTRPGMPPDSGGILRRCPLLGGAICPHVVPRADLARCRARWEQLQSFQDCFSESQGQILVLTLVL